MAKTDKVLDRANKKRKNKMKTTTNKARHLNLLKKHSTRCG